jgi:iron complex transport system permease protein
VLVWRARGWSLRWHRRTVTTLVTLLVVAAVLAVAGLMLGELDLGPGQVLGALTGSADDPLAGYFVSEVRLPRVVAGLAVGAALGGSGALFQTVTGNPLGSPDLVGFTAGSATGAVVAIMATGGGPGATATGALLGGVLTALFVGGLARRQGLSGQRLVLVGLGVGATLTAIDRLLLARADLATAQDAAQWLAGSLDGLLWHRVAPAAIAIAVLLALAALLARPLALLSLGDDVARAAGVDAPRVRGLAVLVGVVLVALATATAGPVAFVALAAPQIARRLTRGAAPAVVTSALTGAVVVVASDLIAQRIFAPTQLAVGVVTGAVGGVYLVVLLATQWRGTR